MYDICIIGAGIAGLYCARELQRKMPEAKICILEKWKEIGGRLYTFHTTVNGKHLSWEAGAGRIHKSHHNVLKLLKEYNIDTIPITGTLEWRTPEGSEPIHFTKMLANLELHRIPEKDLEAKTLKEIFTEIMGTKKAQEFMDRYEYRSELDTLKASKALETLHYELGQHNGFSVIKGGFSLLVEKLKQSIPNVKILTEYEVTDIQSNKVLVKGLNDLATWWLP
jgi:protoporphyrinogen oxidase